MTRARLALLLLALLAAPPVDAQAGIAAECPGGRIVTADDLRDAGAGRLGDALRLVAPLRAWTVDGFDAEPRDARGAVALLVDGVPWQGTTTVEPGMLDALPVAVSEVYSLTYCPAGRLVAGRIGGATLDVRTSGPQTVAALVDYGNETGDPGPARYLDPGLPNSDHWGPDGELVARSGRAWATLRARSFLPTDTAIVARTSAASGRFPEHQTLLGAVAVRLPGRESRGRIAAFASGELPFLPRAQREVAVRRRWAQGSLRLQRRGYAPSVDVWGGVRTLGAPTWAAPDSAVARVSDWREATATASASRYVTHRLAAGLRGSVTQARGDERLPAFDAPIRQANALAAVGSVWGELALRSGSLSPPRLAGELSLATRADGGLRPGGGLSVISRGRGLAQWTATVRRTPAASAPDAGYWRAAGLAPLVRDGGEGADIATDEAAARVALTLPTASVRNLLCWDWIVFPRISLATGWTRGPEPVAVPSGPTVLVQTEAWSRGWAELTASADAQSDAWRLSADGALTLTQSLGDVSRTRPIRTIWAEAPMLQLGAAASYRVGRSLALSARAEAGTAAHSRAVRGDLPSRVPGGVVVDLSVRRSVWKDRLALALTGHNVFGAPEQPSALGARLGPRLHIRLIGRF